MHCFNDVIMLINFQECILSNSNEAQVVVCHCPLCIPLHISAVIMHGERCMSKVFEKSRSIATLHVMTVY